MKSQQQLEEIQKEIISQIPELILKVGKEEDEGQSLAMIADFTAKLAMINFVLEDRPISFNIVEQATMNAVESQLDRLLNKSSKSQSTPFDNLIKAILSK